jgi:hypothetical protein
MRFASTRTDGRTSVSATAVHLHLHLHLRFRAHLQRDE